MKTLLLALAGLVLAIIATWLALATVKLPVRLFALAAIALTMFGTWFALSHTHRPRDPIAWYSSWGGYWHPVMLYDRITKEKADEIAAEGYAYMIGEYDEEGQLVRVTKILKGEVFFEYSYSYHGNGRLKTARVARGGHVTVLEYDERGRSPPGQRSAL